MASRTQILLVEDSEDDAELMVKELGRGGLDFTYRRVHQRSEFLKELKEFCPDLVLADYKLPTFDGLEALALVQEHCPDTPLIVVSGVLGEEVAVETLRRGATDYILKDRLLRLVPAVRRALEERSLRLKRRQADAAARESEIKFAALAESVPAVIFVHQDGKFRYVNSAAEQILGYLRSDLLSMNFWEVVHPDFRELIRSQGRRRQEGEPLPARSEFQIVTKTGEVRWLECTASRLHLADGACVLGSAFDVTERKRITEQSAAFARMSHQLSAARTARDAALIIVGVALDLFGWDACYLHMYSAERRQLVPILTMDTVEGSRVDVPESTFTLDPSPMMLKVLADGARLIHRSERGAVGRFGTPELTSFGDKSRPSACMMYVPIRHGPRNIGIYSIQSYTPNAYNESDLEVFQTMADHGAAALERIQMESALRQNELNNRLLLEALPHWMFRIGKDGIILDYKAPRKLPPFAGEEWPLAGKSIYEICPQALLDLLRHHLDLVLRTRQPETFEFRYEPAGEGRAFEAQLVASGEEEVVGIVRDVSERERLEREILEISNREQRRIGHDLHDGLGQYLAGVALKAKVLEESLEAESSTWVAPARELVRLVHNAIGQTHSLARGLDPIDVEANGLLSAMERLAGEAQQLFHIACVFQCSEPALSLDKNVSLQLFRIAQGAIHNAVSRGRARRVEVDLTILPRHLSLAIRDNGNGFPYHQPAGGEEIPAGMGLRIMEYRARAIGAELKIQSRSTQGTEVQCLLPYPAPHSSSPREAV